MSPSDPLPAPAPPPEPPPRPLDGLWLALGLVSRLPVPAPHGLQPAARFVGWLGPAGLVMGAITGLALAGMTELIADRWIAAFVALIAAALAGGLIHEDGLADVADGFGGGHDREAKLVIMKDSRVGTFGASALILSFGLRAAVLAALAPLGWGAAALVIAAGGLSRVAVAVAMTAMPMARRSRPGLADAAGRSPLAPALTGAGATLLVSMALVRLGLGPVGWPALAGLIAGTVLAGLAMAMIARRQIGGATGDVYGAIQQTAEIAGLVLAFGGVLWWV
ncbi:adenosylcobinamide-GDP ribazoletransferase [Tistrella bauzanensis]|uniref:Adenosylcobinamide-GDP ribazoletransferase n=1 Tax=Tistrella arctica TaxID=3133430 RepID=A0ABU9YFW4_9PROT